MGASPRWRRSVCLRWLRRRCHRRGPRRFLRTLPPPVRSSASLPPVMRSGPTSLSRSSIGTAAISRSMAGGQGCRNRPRRSIPYRRCVAMVCRRRPCRRRQVVRTSGNFRRASSAQLVFVRHAIGAGGAAAIGCDARRRATRRVLCRRSRSAAVDYLSNPHRAFVSCRGVDSRLQPSFDRSSCRGNRDRASSLPPAIGGPDFSLVRR